MLKISVITAAHNRVGTIGEAVMSVQQQTYSDVEHVVIDGASSDGTVALLKSLAAEMDDAMIFVSEQDKGIYDALNKGFILSTGDIIGLMHSDDFYTDEHVLAEVMAAFNDPAIDAVYGDLEYVDKIDTSRVVRHWCSGQYIPDRLAWGWMPPHPALFLRRQVIEQWGGYDTSFRIAADYDAILRYFGKGGLRASYIPRVLVKMRVGGESNRSLSKIVLKSREDYRALKKNGVGGLGTLAWKNVSKICQFL
jgi:glycosyltransferase